MNIQIYFWLIVIFLLLYPPLKAQESENSYPQIDNLETLLAKASSQKLKAKLWDQLAVAYQEVDFEKTISYVDKIIAYTQKQKNDTLQIKAYQTKGNTLCTKGETKQGIKFLEKSLVISQKIKDIKFITKAHLHLGNQYYNIGENESAQIHCQSALKFAQKLDNQILITQAQECNANMLLAKGEFKKALQEFEKTLKIFKSLNFEEGIQSSYRKIGIIYYQIDDYDKAIEMFKNTLLIAQKRRASLTIGTVNYQLGVVYRLLGDQIQARDRLQKAYEIFLDLNAPERLANCYNAIALVYNQMKEFQNALELFHKAFNIYKELDDKIGISIVLGNLGITYKELKQFDKALKFYKKCLAIDIELKDEPSIGYDYEQISGIYIELKQYDKAIEFAQKALEITEEKGMKTVSCSAYLSLGKAYLNMDNLPLAQLSGEKAYQLAIEAERILSQAHASSLLANVYEALHNYEKALRYYKTFKANSDSIWNEQDVRKFTTLENEYKYEKEKALAKLEQEKKEAALAAKIQQQKTLRNAFIIGFMLVLLLAFFILRSYLIKRKANQILSEKNDLISLQAEELKITNENLAEMDRFKQDMTHMLVHDLKNPLNSIIGLTTLEQSPQHYKAIHHSGQNMLNLVSNMLDVQKFEEAEVKLQTSLVNLRNLFYTAYQQVEYLFKEKNIQFNLDVSEDQQIALDAELIQRVMVNLLNNASKYTPNNGQVTILAENLEQVSPSQIKVYVIDNGIGIAPENLEYIFHKYSHLDTTITVRGQSTGLGLTFCKLVVEAHDGEIGVISKPKEGSTFWFTLPQNTTINRHTEKNFIEKNIESVSKEWSLDENDKQKLLPYVTKIRNHQIFEVSLIKSILTPLDTHKAENLSHWKEALESSMYAGNEDRFEELLHMVA